MNENTMLFDTYSNFVAKILNKLTNLGICLDELTIDHLGYQADSSQDYEDKLKLVRGKVSQLSESIVEGRRVGIFKLNESLSYEDQIFNTIEVVEPKEGQSVPSGWEHIEFIVKGSLEEFINQYPEMDWNKSAIDREEFPMIVLPLGDGLKAKFPRLGVKYELARQREMNL